MTMMGVIDQCCYIRRIPYVYNVYATYFEIFNKKFINTYIRSYDKRELSVLNMG
jgi:hypothetical protein